MMVPGFGGFSAARRGRETRNAASARAAKVGSATCPFMSLFLSSIARGMELRAWAPSKRQVAGSFRSAGFSPRSRLHSSQTCGPKATLRQTPRRWSNEMARNSSPTPARVLEPLRQQAYLPQCGGEIPVIGVAGDLAFGQVNDRRAAHRDLLARLPEGVGRAPEPLDEHVPAAVPVAFLHRVHQREDGIGRSHREI